MNPAPQKSLRVLNVGGNSKKIPIPEYYAEWEHLLLDIDPTGKPDVCCDARDMLTLDRAAFDAVYCSHNLEHFFSHDVPKVLKGFHHVLGDEGFAEIRVPDIGLMMKTVVEKGLDIEDVLYTSDIGPIHVADVLFGLRTQIERSGVDFYAHKTGFTKKSLTTALAKAGFPVVVFRAGRYLELLAIGFKKLPTEAQQRLLGMDIKKQLEDAAG